MANHHSKKHPPIDALPEERSPIAAEQAADEPPKAPAADPKRRLVIWLAVIAAVLITAAVITGILASRSSPALPDSPEVLSGDGVSLTNRQFAYYYWNEYVYLCSQEVPPFDRGRALAAQWYDETTTWQQHLTDLAMDTARQTLSFCRAAEQEGFTLPESYAATLAEQKAAYRKQAADDGYADRMEEFLIDLYGPEANEADFDAYLDATFLATAYSDHLMAEPEFPDQVLSAYFDDYADIYLTNYFVRKDDTRALDLRCIFLTGADSEARAEELQAAYLEEPSEESFALLASQYNEDESADEQGLYRNVVPSRADESLRDWCFAADRQVGDETVLSIEIGHVLVYVSSKSDTPLWKAMAESDLRFETYNSACIQLENACAFVAHPEAVNLPVPEGMIPDEKQPAH